VEEKGEVMFLINRQTIVWTTWRSQNGHLFG